MKKYIFLLFILYFAASAEAQVVERVKTNSFTQTLFPKVKLPSSVRNYSALIKTSYLADDSSFRKLAEEKFQQDIKNYPKLLADSERDFNQNAMIDYNKKVADAQEKFKIESDAYNKMTLVERLALIDKKPILNLPSKPYYQAPPEPRLESINTSEVIIMNPETLAKSYIRLEGFGDGNDGLQIVIDFKGFEYIEPVATIVDMENYNPATKEKFYTKQTQYVTKYRHPATLTVTSEGKQLDSGIFQQTGAFQTMSTSAKPTKLYIERQEVEKVLSNMNNYLNAKYGYAKVTRYPVLFSVKNKKGEYDDIEKARDFAFSGYKNYDQNQAEAIKDLQNAIAIWEKTMTEVNYDDSKARIDEKVGMAVLKNLIFATLMANDLEKAEKYITDFKKLRLTYDDKQFADSYEKIYSDLKTRFNG